MCGIAGIYRRGGGLVPESRLRAMQQDQVHRGPDDSGMRAGERIGLVFNRLAIIDLSPAANQPMMSEDDGVWIVFNGEIYNYRQLRDDLRQAGRTFRTQSDTEVLLRGYQEWGTGVFRRL